MTSTPIAPLLRRAATAVAVGRVALGATALAWPSVPARPWVGAAADDVAARVFGRALGARDLALGLGALVALQGPAAQAGSARAWVAAGALSDALDVVATVSSWREAAAGHPVAGRRVGGRCGASGRGRGRGRGRREAGPGPLALMPQAAAAVDCVAARA